jgi:hypothetical protein
MMAHFKATSTSTTTPPYQKLPTRLLLANGGLATKIGDDLNVAQFGVGLCPSFGPRGYEIMAEWGSGVRGSGRKHSHAILDRPSRQLTTGTPSNFLCTPEAKAPTCITMCSSSYQIPPSEVACDSRLDIESCIERCPWPVVRQLKRESVYYLRHNLVDLGHSKLLIR